MTAIISGLHHITVISSNAQRNLSFLFGGFTGTMSGSDFHRPCS